MEEKEFKEKFGGKEDFFMKFNPEKQISMSEKEIAIFGDFPTLQAICLAYGENTAKEWLLPHIVDLAVYYSARHLTNGQFQELAAIIDKECKDLKVSEVMHFFYCLKAGRLNVSEQLSPMSVIVSLRNFLSERNGLLWDKYKVDLNKVYLLVEDHPKTKVYARVFKTQESAEKALQERDERTGERLYPACHVIERIIE